MKRLLLIVSCFFSLHSGARAAPADDVDAAIEKLLSAANFAWTVNWLHVGPSSRFRYEGITEPLGATVVRLDRHGLRMGKIPEGDAPITVVFVGERSVVELDRAWLIPRELGPAGFVPSADAGTFIPGASSSSVIPDRRTTGATVSGIYLRTEPGYIYLPRVDLILRILRGHLDNVKSSRGKITADLSHQAAAALFALKLALPQVDLGSVATGRFASETTRTSRRPQDAAPAPQELLERSRANSRAGVPRPAERFEQPKGSAIFWVERGALVKFEVQLEATGVWQPASRRSEEAHEVMIAATIENVGTSNVQIPAGARQKLAMP